MAIAGIAENPLPTDAGSLMKGAATYHVPVRASKRLAA
jgi:hypothetical protein